tara:strand:+ start:234 stop:497 length:264 start_codon:yes stop_codon:yes gene_type:complete
MKNLNTSVLVGKKVYVDGWQYDNSGVLLNGVITETLDSTDKFGRLAYTFKTIDSEYTLEWIVVKGLIENGFYKANTMLNSGTSAVIL